MPIRTTKNVSLTPELGAYIDQAVASGQYQPASEMVRAGLRPLRARGLPMRRTPSHAPSAGGRRDAR
jgi:antitoxin ParD1/3/4